MASKALMATLMLASTALSTALSIPACSQSPAAPQPTLTGVKTAQLNVSGAPFGLAYAKNQKDTAFAAIGASLGVLNTSTFPPTVSHYIKLGSTFGYGIALTHDGKYVLVTADQDVFAVDTSLAAAGNPQAFVGTLMSNSSVGGATAIEVTVSPDDKYAFVSEEYGSGMTGYRGDIQVFSLHYPKTTSKNFTGSVVGNAALEYDVVGSTLSPDGKSLYATSESTVEYGVSQGTLSVLDVSTLETAPNKSVKYSVDGGCGAVRNIVSADGKTIWVTARESNSLLAFDVATLASGNGTKALRAAVEVGTSPVGLMFVKNETRILTANSNRFGYKNATSGVSVVDVDAALSGSSKALLGQVLAGAFPREVAVSPDGKTVIVAEYGSDQILSIDVSTLP